MSGDRPDRSGNASPPPDAATVDDAIAALRSLLLAGQLFRQRAADRLGVWIMDSFALSYLASSGPITSGELARGLALPASSVTSLVDRLEASDFATRRPRASDRRVVEVSITDHGSRAVESTAQVAREAMLDLGAEELPTATRVFARMAQVLSDRSAALVDPATTPLCDQSAAPDRRRENDEL